MLMVYKWLSEPYVSVEGKGAFMPSILLNIPEVSDWCSEVRPGADVKASFLTFLWLCRGPSLSSLRAGWASEKCSERNWPQGPVAARWSSQRLPSKDRPPPVPFSPSAPSTCPHLVRCSSLHCPRSNPCLLLVTVKFLYWHWTYILCRFWAKYFIWVSMKLYSHLMR